MFEGTSFPILFEDTHLIAINKPTGILVHRTKISEDKQFVLQILRRQIGQRIYPIHRLDRGTSGVLLFGKNNSIAGELGHLFREQLVEKQYLAIVRGYLPENGIIDYPLAKEKHLPKKEAITHFERLQQVELPIAIGRYTTARYSFLKLRPKTGRSHQIRRHLSHLRHPIIGDKKHGDVKHNKYWQNTLGIKRMLLHAQSLKFQHPITNQSIEILANLDEEFEKAKNMLNL